jgi:hypothetical protein
MFIFAVDTGDVNTPPAILNKCCGARAAATRRLSAGKWRRLLGLSFCPTEHCVVDCHDAIDPAIASDHRREGQHRNDQGRNGFVASHGLTKLPPRSYVQYSYETRS